MSKGTVVLGFGPQSVDWLTKATKVCGPTAVMCPNVARMAGANLAAGDPEALAELRKRLEAGALQAATQANPGLSAAATRWLASGERGVSSETMFTHLTGIDARGGWPNGYPHDPADLRRCRLLLEQVPELAPLLPKMAEVSTVWAALVADWQLICSTMDSEEPDWRQPAGGSATQTYALMKAAIKRGGAIC